MSLRVHAPRFRLARRLRWALGLLALAVALVLAVALAVASAGLPDVLARRIDESMARMGGVVAEFTDVRASPLGSASIGRLEFFEPGHPRAAISLRGVKIRYQWTWGSGLRLEPTRIDVREAEVRSLAPFLPEEEAPPPSLPPEVPAGVAAVPPPTAAPSAPSPIPSGETDVSIRELRFLGTSAGFVRMHLRSDGNRLEMRNLFADISDPREPRQEVRGRLVLTLRFPAGRPVPADGRPIFDGRLTGRIIPSRINPILLSFDATGLADVFAGFDFPVDPPTADVRFDIREKSRKIVADISGGRSLYNGVPVMRLAGTVEVLGDDVDWNNVRVRGLEVVRPEGRASAALDFDFREHGLFLDASSTIDFAHLSRIIGILSGIPWNTYETVGGNTVNAKGFYGFTGATRPTGIRGTLGAGTFSFERRVPAHNITADFEVDDTGYSFRNIQGIVYGGNVHADIRLWPQDGTGDLLMSATGAVRKASVGLMNQDLFHVAIDDPGTADVDFQATFNTERDTTRSMTGFVQGSVRKSQMLRLPLFAGLTDFLADNIPGVDVLVTQDDADFHATLSDNGLHFDRILIEGGLFSISGSGTYWLSDYLDIGVRVSLFRRRTFFGRVLRYALYPVSKLFEMEAQGPLQKPRWSPTTLSLSNREPTDEQKYGPGGSAKPQ